MFRAARLKLTGQYVLLTMLLSLVFSFVFYHFATHELNEGLQNQYHVIIENDRDADNRNSVSAPELHVRARHLVDDLAYFNVAVFVGSLLVGYILAKRTLKPIEEAHDIQVRFTAEASHELRTPITAMKADTESILMEREADPEQLRQTLVSNLQDIERLERLSKHLLNMARYKSNGRENTETVDLKPLLKNVIEEVSRIYVNKKLHVTSTLKPAKIEADPISIEQLFSIVVDNSMKYSHSKGKIRITMSVEEGRIVVRVKDQGVGIASADLPHVDEHFYRSSTVKSLGIASGYGLGLPLAYDIVKLYKGTMDIVSSEGKGTEVSIFLPLKK